MPYTIIGRYVRALGANEITRNHVGDGFPVGQNVSFRRTNMYQTRYAFLLILWWVLVVVVVVVVVVAEGEVVRNEDICGAHNGRRVYLELGEKGILYAKNVSFAKNEPRQDDVPGVYATTNSSHDQCSLELVTCPSCVIIVTFQSLALSHHCGDGGVTMDSPCRCDYVWISEPPYEDVSGTPFCGLYAPITYRSSTRTLSIALLYSQSHKHAFTLEYTAERNRLHLKGTELMTGGAKGLNSTGGGILTSPFFPARYPRDLGLEYVVTCPSEAPSCRIRLLFSDFQLATVSIMEFYDWNGQRLDVSSGARFRPPVIVSSGPSLLIRFYANGGTGLGYKAFYSFVVGHLFDKSIQPITDCGGYVENLGGAITMMDMVGEGVKTYDCVWLIRPPKNFLHMKTHMYLKVITFADMAGNTELVVKQGPTSALLPLEVLRHPARQVQAPRHATTREHVAPVTSGFHVSLRGTFGPSSHLAIAYAAFGYTDCFAGSDFLCQNHRCIPSQLNCDGFDHCGDNSDEPATCFRDWEVEPQDRKWHANKANYYFPKIDRYPDLKTATLVFVASSLGLIVLISALIILLYRMGARARQQRELQSRLQTISELLDGARIDEISVSDDPPVYEAPPGYDEVVKLGLETEGVGRKKRRNIGREPRGRISPSQCSLDQGQSSTCLAGEGTSTSRGSQTTPVPPTGKRQRRVPESPPPPYVTPPGTVPRRFNAIGLPVASEARIVPSPEEEDEEDDEEEQEDGEHRKWTDEQTREVESEAGEVDGEKNAVIETAEERSRQQDEPARAKETLESETAAAEEPETEEGRPGESVDSRRECFRRSGEVSRSSGETDVPRFQGLFSPNEAEVLGAYLRERDVSSSICTAESSDPQPKNSRDASTDIGRESEASLDRSRGSAEEGVSRGGGGGEDVGSLEGDTVAGCSCEGACGCATRRRVFLLGKTAGMVSRASGVGEEGGSSSSSSLEGERTESAVKARRRFFERVEGEDRSCPRSAILKLLGSKAGGKSQGAGVHSAYSAPSVSNSGPASAPSAVSTATSTPSGTLRKSARKFSVCSRDSYVGRISSVSSCSSYEKLRDEFDTVSEAASALQRAELADQRRRTRRYSSCDLESLYEGIKILDNFLARRGLSVGQGRKQSVAVMLFGTPEHGPTRASGNLGGAEEGRFWEGGRGERRRRRVRDSCEYEDEVTRRRARVWRFSEEALSNRSIEIAPPNVGGTRANVPA